MVCVVTSLEKLSLQKLIKFGGIRLRLSIEVGVSRKSVDDCFEPEASVNRNSAVSGSMDSEKRGGSLCVLGELVLVWADRCYVRKERHLDDIEESCMTNTLFLSLGKSSKWA